MPLPNPRDTLEVEPDAVRDLLARRNDHPLRLVDCREEDESAICRIEGADLVPLSRFAEAASALAASAGRQPVIIYCHHGVRSAHAANLLRARGVDRVFSMRGGIDAWSREVDPSVPTY